MLDEINKYLYDIKQAITEINEYTKKESFESFSSNSMIQSAVERKFEIIGEALNKIKKLDETVLDSFTDAGKIIGFRNIIIHGYDILDEKIIWDAVQNNVPKLLKEINSLLA